MKKFFLVLLVLCLIPVTAGCKEKPKGNTVVATTKPVYDFTLALCKDTDIAVTLLITENLSCLHDYTLQVGQMQNIENADGIILSGAGLEDFLGEVINDQETVIDASEGVELSCSSEEHHHHDGHHHESDPHIWLSVKNANTMVQNIYRGLMTLYPQWESAITANLAVLQTKLNQLQVYGKETLKNLSSREIITFHDGFSYFAEEFDLHILHAVEEESGSEASAAELKHLITLVREHKLSAIFTEENGSTSAAGVVAAETGVPSYTLSMGMGKSDYFETMYHNINTIKEALE